MDSLWTAPVGAMECAAMHEISIMQGALEMAEQTARASAARQIHCVRMRVGAMSGVVVEALQFAFEALREGTLAADATLEIETVPGCGWCEHCQSEFTAEDWLPECPRCRQMAAGWRRGMELELASLEVT